MTKPSNLQGSVLADNVDPVTSGTNAGIMNHGTPPGDSPMDVFQPIFISSHPAETSVPWQLVSWLQQVVLEDKQDTSRAEGMHTAACGEQKKDGQASAEKVLYMYTLSL